MAAMANNAFPDVLVKDVIPMIDSTFRTIADRNHRAMAGLSMGGFQTFQTTMTHPDLFAYVGGFSGAAFLHPTLISKKHLTGCGPMPGLLMRK